MILYPILAREFKRAAAKSILRWARVGTALAGIAIALPLVRFTVSWSYGASVGRDLFQEITWLTFFLCLASGVFLTSNLLCEERREGSLALLFLTRASGLDVLMGKIIPTALLASQMVLSIFPIMALCLVLGGVSLREFVRATEVLLTTLFFSLSAGLFVSALNRSMARAALFSFLFIVSITGLLLTADWISRNSFLPTRVGLIVPGPVQMMASVPDSAHVLAPDAFHEALVFHVTLCAGLLLLGGMLLKRLAIATDAPLNQRCYRTRRRAGLRVGRRRRANPVYWLIARERGRWTFALFPALLLAWTAVLEMFRFHAASDLLMAFLLGPVIHLLFKVVIASEAAECFAPARTQELELLLVSAISVNKIIEGSAKGLLRRFGWPIAAMLGADLILIFTYKPQAGMPGADGPAAYLLLFTLGITLLVDLPALVWVGLWNGLRSRTALEAVKRTLVEVILYPVPAFLGFFGIIAWMFLVIVSPTLASLGFHAQAGDDEQSLAGLIVIWWVASFVINTLLQREARAHLTTRLRYICADPAKGRRSVKAARSPLDRALPSLSFPVHSS